MVNSYIVSAHPYVFDAMFVSGGSSENRWTGKGSVTLHTKSGGVNLAWALLEADEQGYAELKEAGFNVRIANRGRYVDPLGTSYVVLEDGGPVSREPDRAGGC